MDSVHTAIAWYQTKIGAYDKQLWEQSVEKNLQKQPRFILHSAPRKNVHLKTEYIDVDLIQGSSFTKAKPQVPWVYITRKVIARVVFFPFYYSWWIHQTSRKLYYILLALYTLQVVTVLVYLSSFDSIEDELSFTEVIVPLILMFLLCLIHSQTVLAQITHKPPKHSKTISGVTGKPRLKRTSHRVRPADSTCQEKDGNSGLPKTSARPGCTESHISKVITEKNLDSAMPSSIDMESNLMSRSVSDYDLKPAINSTRSELLQSSPSSSVRSHNVVYKHETQKSSYRPSDRDSSGRQKRSHTWAREINACTQPGKWGDRAVDATQTVYASGCSYKLLDNLPNLLTVEKVVRLVQVDNSCQGDRGQLAEKVSFEQGQVENVSCEHGWAEKISWEHERAEVNCEGHQRQSTGANVQHRKLNVDCEENIDSVDLSKSCLCGNNKDNENEDGRVKPFADFVGSDGIHRVVSDVDSVDTWHASNHTPTSGEERQPSFGIRHDSNSVDFRGCSFNSSKSLTCVMRADCHYDTKNQSDDVTKTYLVGGQRLLQDTHRDHCHFFGDTSTGYYSLTANPHASDVQFVDHHVVGRKSISLPSSTTAEEESSVSCQCHDRKQVSYLELSGSNSLPSSVKDLSSGVRVSSSSSSSSCEFEKDLVTHSTTSSSVFSQVQTGILVSHPENVYSITAENLCLTSKVCTLPCELLDKYPVPHSAIPSMSVQVPTTATVPLISVQVPTATVPLTSAPVSKIPTGTVAVQELAGNSQHYSVPARGLDENSSSVHDNFLASFRIHSGLDEEKDDLAEESLELVNFSEGERQADDLSSYNPSDSDDMDSDGSHNDIPRRYEEKWKRLRFQVQASDSEYSEKATPSDGKPMDPRPAGLSTKSARAATRRETTVTKTGIPSPDGESRSLVGILTRNLSPLKDVAIGRKPTINQPVANSLGNDKGPSETHNQLRQRRRPPGTSLEAGQTTSNRNLSNSLGLRHPDGKKRNMISSDSNAGCLLIPEETNKATLSSEEWEDRIQSDETTSSAYSSNSEMDTEEKLEEEVEEKAECTAGGVSMINLLQPQSGSPTNLGFTVQPDRVSCLIWERNECKKTDLTALDIGWAIMDKVNSLPESSDYFIIGLLFTVIISLVPLAFCAYANKELPGADDFLTWSALVAKLADFSSLIASTYSWRQLLLMFNGIVQRIFLSLIFFFLLSVADCTFKQRLLYAKHFSYLTSFRRARKFSMPHFRLNKVRNIKVWLSLRSYLKRRGPQRSVDVIVSACFLVAVSIVCLVSIQMLKDTVSFLDYLCNWELLVWCLALGVFLMRFMTLGLKINKKYGNLSVLITEQINLYLQMEQKPHKKEELILANNVLRLAEDLLKELESPFKISGFSANPLIYNILRVVVLSAFSAVLTEVLGFKLKLHKIKLKA